MATSTIKSSINLKVLSISGTTNTDGNFRTTIPQTAKIISYSLSATSVLFTAYNVYWVKAYTNDSSGTVKINPNTSISGNIYYLDD